MRQRFHHHLCASLTFDLLYGSHLGFSSLWLEESNKHVPGNERAIRACGGLANCSLKCLAQNPVKAERLNPSTALGMEGTQTAEGMMGLETVSQWQRQLQPHLFGGNALCLWLLQQGEGTSLLLPVYINPTSCLRCRHVICLCFFNQKTF